MRFNQETYWPIGWGSVNGDGAVEQAFLSCAHMRAVDKCVLAPSAPPEPVFSGAAEAVFIESRVPGLLFECTYDPAQGTMRARYPNARVPALQPSCLLFNDIPVGTPLVPVIRFGSRSAVVGCSVTLMDA